MIQLVDLRTLSLGEYYITCHHNSQLSALLDVNFELIFYRKKLSHLQTFVLCTYLHIAPFFLIIYVTIIFEICKLLLFSREGASSLLSSIYSLISLPISFRILNFCFNDTFSTISIFRLFCHFLYYLGNICLFLSSGDAEQGKC